MGRPLRRGRPGDLRRTRLAAWTGLAVAGAVVAAAAAELPELARHLDIGGVRGTTGPDFARHWLEAAGAAAAGILLAGWCAGAGEAGRRWLKTGGRWAGWERLAGRVLLGVGSGPR